MTGMMILAANRSYLISRTAYTNTTNGSIIVPAYANWMLAKLWGAGGAAAPGGGIQPGGDGGGGGYAKAIIQVIPGETLTNNCGAGGAFLGGINQTQGGKLCFIQRDSDSAYLIIAGSGGSGTQDNGLQPGRFGGAGGGNTGQDGQISTDGGVATGGGGATQSAGGTAGSGSIDGTAGSLLTPGNGAVSGGNYAGQGGYGYYGGGGGALPSTGKGSGGGGGSGLVTGVSTVSTTGSGRSVANSSDPDYTSNYGEGGFGPLGIVFNPGIQGYMVVYFYAGFPGLGA